MSPVNIARNALSTMTEQVRWLDLMVSFLANLGAMAALLLLLWSLFSGSAMTKVTEVLKEELGTDMILATAERNSQKVEALTEKVDGYVAELRERFPVKISDINYTLSRVMQPCRQFSECRALFFVRRYDAWLHCDAPVVLQHIIMDYDGIEHPTQPGPANRAIRAGNSLIRIVVGFVPDDQVSPGKAFFMMLLQYKCGDEMVEQMTEPLPFDLQPVRRAP